MLRLLPAAHLARTLAGAPALAHPLRAALTTPSPSSHSLLPASSSRLLSSSAPAFAAKRETTNLTSSAGSGQGGKKEKEAARKEKERARKEREKERARRAKEKAQEQKEKDKARKEREKAKLEKEKDKARKLKERERAAKEKASQPRKRSTLHPPKAPGNSWNIFFTDYVAEHKANAAPGSKMSLTELVKEATPKYQSLSSDEKAVLKERAEEQKRAYPAILEAWKATLTPEMIRQENQVRLYRRKLGLSNRKPLKMEGEPKRPVTGFIRFSQELREKGDAFDGETDIIKQSTLIAARWRELSEEDKKVYNDAYLADKERYEREKAEFEASLAAKRSDASSSSTA